jgi:rubrerythrin
VTVTFRIESIRLDTVGGAVSYEFPADLTVLAGQTGVGKTTLLELIKFSLGGDGLIAPVVQEKVVDVHISVRVGTAHLQISRGIGQEQRSRVRVVDLTTRERLRDHTVGGESPTLSDLLLTSMGMGTGLRAAARGSRSTSAGAQITFNDVFRFMYIPQAEMNRDIAASRESYYTPKRKAVFELLFRLTSSELLDGRSEVNSLRSEIENAKRDADAVTEFLVSSGLTSRIEAELRQSQAQQDERAALVVLKELQADLSDAVDRETQTLRTLLNDAERSVAEADQHAIELQRLQREYEAEQRRVAQDIERLRRMASAGDRLASIEFSVCPRCTQSLAGRQVPDGVCRVCLQADIVADLPDREQYEIEQLRSQLAEVGEQLAVIQEQLGQTASAARDRTELVRKLTAEIDARTANRVTPRLQAYADAAAKAARARTEQELLEQVLRQWDRAHDLTEAVEELERRRDVLAARIRALESDFARRKEEIFTELDAEFQRTVSDFGIPNGQAASISPESYLPLLNGEQFDRVSSGGGIVTATQVAYWITLITVAARRRDTDVPAFLLLDSPRLALNTAEDIAAQMYRRFVTQVGAAPGRLQFIVADNELPTEYEREFDEIVFSYDSPTVSTVAHPGPANVQLLVGEDREDDD